MDEKDEICRCTIKRNNGKGSTRMIVVHGICVKAQLLRHRVQCDVTSINCTRKIGWCFSYKWKKYWCIRWIFVWSVEYIRMLYNKYFWALAERLIWQSLLNEDIKMEWCEVSTSPKSHLFLWGNRNSEIGLGRSVFHYVSWCVG